MAVLPRPHQIDALESVERAFASGSRAQVTMPCGTGKTLVGRWAAERLEARVTVVLVPSLALVAQTLRAWRSVGGWAFESTVVCSDPSTARGRDERNETAEATGADEPWWAAQEARVTMDSGVVATRLTRNMGRRCVVFSTYHSAPVVAEALRSSGVEADLVVADESHRLAGWPREDFRVALDDRLPAVRRLFMTATPVRARSRLAGSLSMDDETVFGPVAYSLSFAEAVARGLLVDYQVVVYETTRSSDGHPDARDALMVAARNGLSSVLTFHGRLAKARDFAATIDGSRLEDGRTVRACAVAGSDSIRTREQALETLVDPGADEMSVVSSARCLSEGVDVPSVDGALFADPKSSEVDIVQAIGRCLRTHPGKQVGTILLPVCLDDAVDADSDLSTGKFAGVWRVLRELRSMDSRLDAEMGLAGADASRRGRHDSSRKARVVFDLPSANDLDGLLARVLSQTATAAAWEEWADRLDVYVAEHGSARMSRGTALGEWCVRQRLAYSHQMLSAGRTARLAALPGWAWDVNEQRWMEQFAQVAGEAVRRRGPIPVSDPRFASVKMVRTGPRQPKTIGTWCAAQRIQERRGGLSQRQLSLLAQIHGWRRSHLDESDEMCVDLLSEYAAWKGTANPPASYVEDGQPVGRWLNRVRRASVVGTLDQRLRDELVAAVPQHPMSARVEWHVTEVTWMLGLEALRQHAAREGSCRIGQGHVEVLADTEVRLSEWVTRQRFAARHAEMSEARRGLLDAVPGWVWEVDLREGDRIPIELGDVPHGTGRLGYSRGCRCVPCTKANTAEKQRAVAEGVTDVRVDAGPTRAHLRVLLGRGVLQSALIRASGVGKTAIGQIISGENRRVLPETEAAVLAVTYESVADQKLPRNLVPAGPTWKMLDDLLGRGWSKSWLARELGLGGSLQLRRDAVNVDNARAVAELYERVGSRMAPPPRYRAPALSLAEIVAGEQQDGRRAA